MSKYNYWLEALNASLDDAGIFNALTDEQKSKVARDIEMAHKMHSEATGEINIENPLREEMRQLEKRKDKEISEVKNRERLYEKCLAKHVGVEPRRLYINNDEVFVSRT